LQNVFFINDSIGWAAGENGMIIKTTTGGNPIGIRQISKIVPKDYVLFQNYPNPFNPKTIIKYQLGITGKVKLVIYDLLGKEITKLVNEKQTAGNYQIEWDGSKYASGVYFYKLETESFSTTKKMVLLK